MHTRSLPDFRRLLEQISDGFVALDPEWRFTYANARAGELLGRDPESLLGLGLTEAFPDIPEVFLESFERAGREQVPLSAEAFHAPWDRWFETRAHPTSDGLSVFFQDVTERKRTEDELRRAIDALQASEAKMQLLLADFPGVLWTTDAELRVESCRGAMTAAWGVRVRGASLPELLGAETPAVVMHRRALDGVPGAYRLVLGQRTFESRVAPLRDAAGGVVGTIGVGVDISERSQTEEALRESEERFRQLAEYLHEVFWIHDEGMTQLAYVSPAYEAVWGRSRESLYRDPTSFLDTVHPDDRARVEAEMRRQGAGGYDQRYRVVRPDGTVRWVRDRAYPVPNGAGEVYRIVGVAEDITEAVTARTELERREAYYRSLIENAQDLIAVLDADGTIRYGSPALERLLGFPPEKVAGGSVYGLVHRDDRDRLEETLRRVAGGPGDSFAIELRFPHVDGSWRVLETTGRNLLDDPNVRGIVINSRDVSERVAAERELRALFGAMRDLVMVLDGEGRYLRIAPTSPDLLIRPVEELVGRTLADVAPPDFAARGLAAIQQVLEHGEPTTLEYHLPMGDAERWFSATISPLDAGSVLWVARDVSAGRQREEQLRRAERLASLGTLIGGVAHELNNPLTSIKSFAQLMLTDEPSDSDREGLEIIGREADRAAKIVSHLHLLARRTQGELGSREAVDLGDVIRHVLRLRGYALSIANIELETDLAAELPGVWGDRGEIEQVVINLLINAEQALARAAGRRVVRVRTAARGGVVSLELSDSGPGIHPEHLSHIFDPFFTTKAPGEGTGLGLALVHGIVAEHGGQIRVQSGVGEGATFVVELPARLAAEAAAAKRPAEPLPATRGLRVLIVDDEVGIRKALARALDRRGHSVDEAAEGTEAIGRLRGASYDVVLSDLRMPGLGGEEYLRALQEMDAAITRRLVIVTGDAGTAPGSGLPVPAGVPVLFKPFDLDELIRLVERVGGA